MVRAALVAAVAAGVGAPGASAATLIVDNGTVECPNRDSQTIAGAVAAASPNDTIAICPGLYHEGGIGINKPLTVMGAGADLVRIEAPGAPTPLNDYVLHVTAGGPVHVSGVTIAAGDPDAGRAIRAVDGAIRLDNSGGSLVASRITDLANGVAPGIGIGVLADAGPGALKDVTVAGSVVEDYGPTGILVESSGAAIDAKVSDSVVRGRGPLSTASEAQDGVRIAGANAIATVSGSLIADNRNTLDEVDGAGVRFMNASDASTVTGNDLAGNGYGVFRGDASGRCDVPSPARMIDASGNWWGDPSGPTLDPRVACLPPVIPPTMNGDRVNTGVDTSDHKMTAHGAPTAPAPQSDLPPSLTITAPSEGAEAEPGSAVNVTAAVADDFDVRRVEFWRGTSLVAAQTTGTTPTSSQSISAPAAGESDAVTVIAFDSSGQTDAEAITLRGTPAPVQQPQPPPQTPQQVVEDQPPGVAFTGPSEGAAINPSAPPRLTADASDDRGVARVAFLDDGKVVCTDESAPYDCPYAPTGDDVGRNTLIAIAVDGAGQTAVAFRGVSVARFDPRLTAATTPKRDRKRPYRFTTSGSVLLPTGVTPAQACAAGGSVTVEFRAAKLRLPQTATLRPDCSYRAAIAFPSRRSLGRGRLSVSTKFGGNEVLGTAKARTHRVQAG